MPATPTPPPPPRSRAALAAMVAAVLLLVVANPQRGAAAHGHGHGDGMACSTGTVGECAAGDGAATARRELGGSGYIGYGAMVAGNVPCSYRGASYYNCRPSGAANPYSRGCSAITQCRG